MALIGTKDKKEIVEQFKTNEHDTGSSQVQIAILTERINHLVEHLKIHKKDHHTRRGLLILVGRRKKFLKYLKRTSLTKFSELIKSLKLKG